VARAALPGAEAPACRLPRGARRVMQSVAPRGASQACFAVRRREEKVRRYFPGKSAA